jgi:glycosyltransferase involved in cell wall biosynthesis
MEKITAIVFALNEEKNIPSLVENLKDLDEIIVVDHESTDNTAKIAKKLGCKVVKRPVPTRTPTQEDVDTFTQRYGFAPHFKANVPIFAWDKEANSSLKLGKNDWHLYIDCDERVLWNFKDVQSSLPFFDAITCPLDNGRMVISTIKLFRRSKMWFMGMTHCAAMGFDIRVREPKGMVIKHSQEFKDYRNNNIEIIEYAYYLEQTTHMLYYLAREYATIGEWEKCLKFSKLYVGAPYKKSDIPLVYINMAWASWELGREEEAMNYALLAQKADPTSKRVFDTLLVFSPPSQKDMYRKFRELAPNQ